MSEDNAGGRDRTPVGIATTLLKGITAFCVAAIMVLTTADVIGRYLLASPIAGAYEISQFLLALASFAALPLVTGKEAHIEIGLLDAVGTGRLAPFRRIVVLLISSAVVALLCVYLFRLAMVLSSDQQTLGAINLPLAPLCYSLSGFASVTTGILLFKLAQTVRTTRQRGSESS